MAVAKRGVGCGGRGSVLRAMGSQGGLWPVSDQQHADERCFRVRQNRVVLTPRRWRQVLRSCVGPTGLKTKQYSQGDGGKKARSPAISCTHLFISGRPVRKTRVLSTFGEGP
jgi:hypothetical protein